MNTLLLQRFSFKNPLEIVEDAKKREVLPLSGKTTIRADRESLSNDLAVLLATAKLAEQDPLLVHFPFKQDRSPETAKWMPVFINLCRPVQSAWIWKTMRTYVPEEYTEKIERLREQWDGYYATAHADGETKAELLPKWDFLTTAAILYENPVNDVNFSISSRMAQEEWDAYIDEIKKLSRMEPDPKLYVLLPNATEVPFTVSISSHSDARHYVIRLLDGVS